LQAARWSAQWGRQAGELHLIEAENRRVGFDRLRSERPALVLLDLMMPVMVGCEFVEEVRDDTELRDVSIVTLQKRDRIRENSSFGTLCAGQLPP